ncbi:alpha/beta hydrolase [Pedobacter sp. MC2016-14]|uniref:alpha/beta hydrolase family protein n=1 Tax=Pedobacter sp. MC2016-14 TaxID=2897327 RepID=UPI001E353B88|nr:alpha/beta hydrolase [Pedobacter sp. MC2016-14]MCD0490399.1 alpha/beta hydrolase [Pedobacter sp. MC2016-14]
MKLFFIIVLSWCLCTPAFSQKTTFKSDSVTFKNTNGSITFGATVSVPASGLSTNNAVVLISGGGMQDRDGKMAGHPWFKVLAEFLNSKGLTVLRMDDRGVGKTTGDYMMATTADFADDALAAITYLQSRKDLRLKKIGLLGHSEGGAASAIAASKSKNVAFIISLSGLAINGMSSLKSQNEDIVNASELKDYDKKRSNDINNLMFQTARKYVDSANMEQKLNETYAEWKKKDDVYFKTLNIEFDHFRFPVYSYVNYAVKPWYRYFLKFDPTDFLPKVKVPILAINGDKDLMVRSAPNLSNWKNLPAKGGNKKVTIKEIPGLNHLLQHCITCQQQEYATIKEDIAPEVLKELGLWLSNNNLGK